MSTFLNSLWSMLWNIPHRAGRSLRRMVLGCLLLFLLIAVACGILATVLVEQVGAAEAPPATALCAYTLLDESVSNSDLGGVGSDPSGLRHEALRLLISYLGIDAAGSSVAGHRVALIHFGTTAQLTVPLTSLDTTGRATLLAQLAPPEPMGWTDHLAALTLAIDDAATNAENCTPVVILFTDGKSDWDASLPVDYSAYRAALRAQVKRLTDMGGRIFIVLLANEATDADAEIAAVWKPLWQEMAAAPVGGSAPGRFYEVRRPEDLLGVYHEIVAALTGHVPAPPVLEVAVSATPTRHIITVERDLVGLTLVIAKSDPAIIAQIFRPDGRRLEASSAGVRHAGGDGAAAEEVWQIEQPVAGQWIVLLSGAGRVLVWKDVRVGSPIPTATAAAPSPAPVPTMPPATSTARHAAPALSSTSAPPTPRATATSVAAAAAPVERAPSPFWLLVVPALLLGAALFLRLRPPPPVVSGALRLLGESAQPIDLESLHRPQLTVGAPPADVVLPTNARFTLAPRHAGDVVEIILCAEGDALHLLSLNGRPAATDQPLRDMDVIRCGDLRLRYENLALRPAEAWPDPIDDLEQLTY